MVGYCSSTPQTHPSRSIRGGIADHDLDALAARRAFRHRDGLRVAAVAETKNYGAVLFAAVIDRLAIAMASAAAVASSSSDALASGSPHRSNAESHRLEVEQRFQPALRDLRLIRRVLGVHGWPSALPFP